MDNKLWGVGGGAGGEGGEAGVWRKNEKYNNL